MKYIDLVISAELKLYLQETIDVNPSAGFELAVIKGRINDNGPERWSMSVVSPDQAHDMKVCPDSYIMADGIKLIISHPNLATELNGKYMDWNDDGVYLIDRS